MFSSVFFFFSDHLIGPLLRSFDNALGQSVDTTYCPSPPTIYIYTYVHTHTHTSPFPYPLLFIKHISYTAHSLTTPSLTTPQTLQRHRRPRHAAGEKTRVRTRLLFQLQQSAVGLRPALAGARAPVRVGYRHAAAGAGGDGVHQGRQQA